MLKKNKKKSSIKIYLASISKETKRLNFICVFSLVLMIFLSPIYGIIWLFFTTLYFLTNDNFNKMYIIWGVYFFSWYLLFIFCMYDFKEEIIITHDFLGYYFFKELNSTVQLFNYTNSKFQDLFINPNPFNAVCANFCLQTIVILSWLSSKLGCNIYIPSIYKGVLYLLKYFSSK